MKIPNLVILIILLPLVSSCVSFSYPDMEELQRKIEEEQVKKNYELHKKLQSSWYGSIISLIYERNEDGILSRKLSKREIKKLESLLNEVSSSTYKVAKRHDDAFFGEFGINKIKKVKFDLEKEDVEYIGMTPSCNDKKIKTTVDTIRKFVITVLGEKKGASLQDELSLFGYSMMGIALDQNDIVLEGRYIDLLLGPALNGARESQLEQAISRESALLWKALSFVIGHESLHIWANECRKEMDTNTQLEREYLADILGVILANEEFASSCGMEVRIPFSAMPAIINDTDYSGNYNATTNHLINVAGRTIYQSSSLFGDSGINVMVEALSKYFKYDSTHVSPEERKIIGSNSSNILTNEVFRQSVDELEDSFLFSLLGLFDVSVEDVVRSEPLYFRPTQFINKRGNICYKPMFEQQSDDTF